jgi:hypothetical protein
LYRIYDEWAKDHDSWAVDKNQPDIMAIIVAGPGIRSKLVLKSKKFPLAFIFSVFYLKDIQRDETLAEIRSRVNAGENLTNMDFFRLPLLPMSGKYTKIR